MWVCFLCLLEHRAFDMQNTICRPLRRSPQDMAEGYLLLPLAGSVCAGAVTPTGGPHGCMLVVAPLPSPAVGLPQHIQRIQMGRAASTGWRWGCAWHGLPRCPCVFYPPRRPCGCLSWAPVRQRAGPTLLLLAPRPAQGVRASMGMCLARTACILQPSLYLLGGMCLCWCGEPACVCMWGDCAACNSWGWRSVSPPPPIVRVGWWVSLWGCVA